MSLVVPAQVESLPIQVPLPVQVPPPNLPMPLHWHGPEGRIASILFKGLCIVSFGRSTLKHTWKVCRVENNAGWKEEKEALIARINNMNVVVCDL